MKTQIKNYTFNKTAKQVTFTDYVTIDLDSILLVTNVTDNVIVYNFADPLKGGTVATNVLTLIYDTGTMDNADKLQIFYEDETVVAAQEATIQDLYNQMALLLDHLEYGNITDKTKTLRVQLNPDLVHAISIAAAQTLATVTTVGTVTNQARIGDVQAQRQIEALLDTAFINGITNNLSF